MTTTFYRMDLIAKLLIKDFSAESLHRNNPFNDKFELPDGTVICSREFERTNIEINEENLKTWVEQIIKQ